MEKVPLKIIRAMGSYISDPRKIKASYSPMNAFVVHFYYNRLNITENKESDDFKMAFMCRLTVQYGRKL